jgi:GDP-4-dehydro-6-deoxy-D-mannose reductase
MRILVTGITGFAGSHLAEQLLAGPGVELFGCSRRGRWPDDCALLQDHVALHACDLTDPAAAEALVREVRPEALYHLAGYAHARRSIDEPDAAWAANLTATRALYEAVLRWGGRPRILFVGSGQVYGECESPEQALDEDRPLRPANPYAASKAAADLVSYQYARAGLDVVIARPFNHIGPRQSPAYAVAHFARQLAEVERGQCPPLLETGNLSPRRDLTDVRDVVRAYRLLLQCGRAGAAYNVGTGEAPSMREVLDRLLALSPARVEVRQRADLVRAGETSVLRADPSRLRRETGWVPAFRLEQSLTDILEYWRQRL